MTTEPSQPDKCFGLECTREPVYIADKIIIYPIGHQPFEGVASVRITVCVRHKNDTLIDTTMINAAIESAKRQAPFLNFRENGEVYWRLM